MNLYLISQDYNPGWDTFDSAVVAANNEGEAKLIHPHKVDNWDGKENSQSTGSIFRTWVDAEDVEVQLIGIAKEGTEKGVILASFNAG